MRQEIIDKIRKHLEKKYGTNFKGIKIKTHFFSFDFTASYNLKTKTVDVAKIYLPVSLLFVLSTFFFAFSTNWFSWIVSLILLSYMYSLLLLTNLQFYVSLNHELIHAILIKKNRSKGYWNDENYCLDNERDNPEIPKLAIWASILLRKITLTDLLFKKGGK